MILVLAFTLLAQPAELDFDFYRTQVEPIFLEKREGYTRCVVCHAGDERAAFLEGLPEGRGDVERGAIAPATSNR